MLTHFSRIGRWPNSRAVWILSTLLIISAFLLAGCNSGAEYTSVALLGGVPSGSIAPSVWNITNTK